MDIVQVPSPGDKRGGALKKGARHQKGLGAREKKKAGQGEETCWGLPRKSRMGTTQREERETVVKHQKGFSETARPDDPRSK